MTLRLGVIGLSVGNGHPYSWSAIFNGYDSLAMEECGFPVIPRYLEKQSWPQDAIREAKVTHIWTQDRKISQHVALAARIENIVNDPKEMIGSIDGLLLARDDAEFHYEMALPFLDAGVPIYIDKPIGLSIAELDRIYEKQRYPGQIFSCSALKYAKEFQFTKDTSRDVGKLQYVDAKVPKDWDKYAVHVIEPLLNLSGDQGKLLSSQRWGYGDKVIVNFLWESGFQATVSTLGATKCPLSLRVMGDRGWCDLEFQDTFFAFKSALKDFVDGINNHDVRSDPVFLRRVVEMIEKGRCK